MLAPLLPLLASRAEAVTPFRLPPGEEPAEWATALDLAGFDIGSGRPGVEVRADGDRWVLLVWDASGGVRSAEVTRPASARAREDLVWLAASLLREADVPAGRTPAMPAVPLPPPRIPSEPVARPIGGRGARRAVGPAPSSGPDTHPLAHVPPPLADGSAAPTPPSAAPPADATPADSAVAPAIVAPPISTVAPPNSAVAPPNSAVAPTNSAVAPRISGVATPPFSAVAPSAVAPPASAAAPPAATIADARPPLDLSASFAGILTFRAGASVAAGGALAITISRANTWIEADAALLAPSAVTSLEPSDSLAFGSFALTAGWAPATGRARPHLGAGLTLQRVTFREDGYAPLAAWVPAPHADAGIALALAPHLALDAGLRATWDTREITFVAEDAPLTEVGRVATSPWLAVKIAPGR
jgi:hypothetical protein